MFYQSFQNMFKDRTLPYYALYVKQDLQHPLQHDPNHPAHPDHPENIVNQIKSGTVTPANNLSRANSIRNFKMSAALSPRDSQGVNGPIDPNTFLSLPSSPVTSPPPAILRSSSVKEQPSQRNLKETVKDPPLILPQHDTRTEGISMGILHPLDNTNFVPDDSLRHAQEMQTLHQNEEALKAHHEISLPFPSNSPNVHHEIILVDHLHDHLHDQSTSSMTTSHSSGDHHDHHSVALLNLKSKAKDANMKMSEYIKKKLTKIKNRLHSNIPKVRAKVEKIEVDSVHAQTVVIPFLLELGKALHLCGVPAHRLEYELTLVATSFGIEGNYFYTPTGIFCSFGDPHTLLSPYTHLIRVGGSDFDLEKLCLLEELALDISQKRLNCSEGVAAIHAIMALPPRYPRLVVVLSIILCSFAIGIMFGLGWMEVGVTSLAAFYVAMIIVMAERVPAVARIMEAISGLGCGFMAAIFCGFIKPINMFIVALGGVIWFVPGLSITLAVSELATRNLISGTSRLMSSFACILQLTFGIEAGIKLGGLMFPPQKGEVYPSLSMYWGWFATVVAGVAFTVLLRVPPKQIWSVFIACFIGTFGGQYGTQAMGNSIGAFFGALCICVFGNCYARVVQRSVSNVPIICGILLLVPGSLGVKSFTAIGNGDVQTGLGNLGTMFQTAMSLAMGLLTANLLVRPYKAL